MNAQLKKGILEKCILLIVKRENSIYGYDLIKKIGVFFPEVNESTFYSILRRLEKREAIISTVEKSTEGPPRKYFSITVSGEVELQELINEWNELKRIMEGLGIE
ncbi:MAG: PadR family transcriptional regulator [Clostridia bacterium]|nr:PadR family transcriptional regulator [Clostridia bacterium]